MAYVKPEQITYKRECKDPSCSWKDDVYRKWAEKDLDWREDLTYECPECGRYSLRISIYIDEWLYQNWSHNGIVTIDPSFWGQCESLRKEQVGVCN